MNQRIRELAEQADIHFSKSGTLDAGPNGIAKFVLYADLEKFAELIAGECLDIAKDVNKNPYLDEHHHARQIIKNITKHFGVEE